MNNQQESLLLEQKRAAPRYRLNRMVRLLPHVLAGTASVVLLLLLSTFFFPVLLPHTILLLSVVFILLTGVLSGLYGWKIPKQELRVEMDAQLHLKDHVLTSGFWHDSRSTEGPWHQAQLGQTLAALRETDWKKVWPVPFPRHLWISGTVLALCLLVSLWQFGFWQQADNKRRAEVAARKENPPQQAKQLEEVFKDWEEAQTIEHDEELAKLLEMVKPLREQMAAGELVEKQMLVEINRIQEKLASRLSELQSNSLASHSAEMAAAFEQMEGAGEFASALRRKDFVAAAAEATTMEKKTSSGEVPMPAGEQAQKISQKLGSSAQAMQQKQSGASSAMNQMAQSMKEGDRQKAAQGWKQMSNAMQSECQKQGACKGLGLQLAQMGQCKGGGDRPGEGKKISMGLPKISLAKSKEPGKGAGTESDPNHFGVETKLDGTREQASLSGMTGEGDSETSTEASNEPNRETATASVAAQNFKAYEKLSQQAVEDESLPLAHRQAIKKYFEQIRPKQN